MANLDVMEYNVEVANTVIEIQVKKAVSQTVVNMGALIDSLRATGASDEVIREVLINDLQTGGRIFGQFKNQFKAIGEFGIGTMANMGIVSEFINTEEGVEQEFKWQAVGKSICPDCEKRHGQSNTWEDWQTLGLPQSGFSVCGMHCKCTLVKSDIWKKNPLKVPIPEE